MHISGFEQGVSLLLQGTGLLRQERRFGQNGFKMTSIKVTDNNNKAKEANLDG